MMMKKCREKQTWRRSQASSVVSLWLLSVFTQNVKSSFFCSSLSFSLFSISFPHLEGAQQNDPPPSHTLLPTNRARESRCTRGQIRKNTIVVRVIISLSVCVCVVFTPPSFLLLVYSFSCAFVLASFLFSFFPYVIFTMRAHMIQVTTVGSRLCVSCDDDLDEELFFFYLIPPFLFAPQREIQQTLVGG